MSIARTDQSMIGRWWWTVDRWTVLAIGVLCGFGGLLILAASPAVAERIGADSFYFVRHQMMIMPLALGLMFFISLQSPRTIRRVAMVAPRANFVPSIMSATNTPDVISTLLPTASSFDAKLPSS